LIITSRIKNIFLQCGEPMGRKAVSHVRAHRSRILVKYLYYRISGHHILQN